MFGRDELDEEDDTLANSVDEADSDVDDDVDGADIGVATRLTTPASLPAAAPSAVLVAARRQLTMTTTTAMTLTTAVHARTSSVTGHAASRHDERNRVDESKSDERASVTETDGHARLFLAVLSPAASSCDEQPCSGQA